MSKRVKIVCAAIKLKSGRIVCGVRHFDELMLQNLPPNTEEGRAACEGHQQGFVDNRYKFVTREQAYRTALAARQFDPDSPHYKGIRGSLFSEDLY